ncbi:arf-GAP domain and FG repeat-containing protein 1-like [Varroa jacobsoni]|uniref:arf-GAP domain and FG repeat-containing protein 1-like n=1 Tax=Varroa jacobsoni TaxID=62625 RepID=UPI000BF869DB|nr:arf-GAP domain and FG repeat-containing protein 1-like [Varroa jacobsoni]
MAARSKRSADERRLAHLREIANEGANRNCLECHQRGPTYVDMTIGSFVCTKCCGLLRGLNPPHRTKSITMTSFSDDELDFIKNRGNEAGYNTETMETIMDDRPGHMRWTLLLVRLIVLPICR